jgi:predicted RNase H-like HicB family nuclease
VATGDSIDSCIEEMRSALEGHIALMHQHDEPAPEPSGPGVYVERAVAA